MSSLHSSDGSDFWTILHAVASRLSVPNRGIEERLEAILDAAMALSGACRGFVQQASCEATPGILRGIDDEGKRLESVTPLSRSRVGEILEMGQRIEASGDALTRLASDVGSAEAVLGVPLPGALRVEEEPDMERRQIQLPGAGVAVGALVLEFDLEEPEEEVVAPLELVAVLGASALRGDGVSDGDGFDAHCSLLGSRIWRMGFEQELEVGLREKVPLTLVLLQMDGEEALSGGTGMRVTWSRPFLRLVGSALVGSTRKVDLCARQAGGEFSIVLPATDAKGADGFSARLSEAIASLDLQDEEIQATYSVGGATCPEDGVSALELLRVARRRLEEARSQGGGRSVLDGEGFVGGATVRQETIDGLLFGADVQIREQILGWVESQYRALDGDFEGALTALSVWVGARTASLWKGENARSLEGILGLSRSGVVLDVGTLVPPPVTLVENAERNRVSQILVEEDSCGLVVPLSLRGQFEGVVYLAGLNPAQESLCSLLALVPPLAFVLDSPGLDSQSSQLPSSTPVAISAEESESASSVTSTRSRLKYEYEEILGESPAMVSLLGILDKIVESEVPVLIQGESGTGKELVARAIHRLGSRSKKAYVSENCAAVTETLLESELFGYMKGAFTGAGQDKKGLFEVADGGTLFLDEVGDMSLGMQKKLLRALQEGEIRPVGGKGVRNVDVRVLSATNRDLKKAMEEGFFREDLYYRLNVVNVVLPPLRDRDGDVPLLLEFFLAKTVEELGVGKRELAAETRAALLAHDWPGNIREMENEVKRIVALGDEIITPDIISPRILENYQQQDGD